MINYAEEVRFCQTKKVTLKRRCLVYFDIQFLQHKYQYLPSTLQYYALSLQNRREAKKKKESKPFSFKSLIKWKSAVKAASGSSKDGEPQGGHGAQGAGQGSGSMAQGGSGQPSGSGGASGGETGTSGASGGAGGDGPPPPGPPRPPGPASVPPGADDDSNDEEEEECDENEGGNYQHYPARISAEKLKVYHTLPNNPTPNYLYRVFDAACNDGSSWKENDNFRKSVKKSRKEVVWSKICELVTQIIIAWFIKESMLSIIF